MSARDVGAMHGRQAAEEWLRSCQHSSLCAIHLPSIKGLRCDCGAWSNGWLEPEPDVRNLGAGSDRDLDDYCAAFRAAIRYYTHQAKRTHQELPHLAADGRES